MVWTPGKGGSKASQDYYKEKQAEYGRRPDKKEKKSWSGDYGEKEDRSQDKGGKIPSKPALARSGSILRIPCFPRAYRFAGPSPAKSFLL